MVVQDADRLDAMGAIGIARAFAYAGYIQESFHNPDIKPKNYRSFEEYKKRKTTVINYFYEKTLLAKSLMNTATARRIADGRHRFMEQYLERFFLEWEGRD
jgi:uncharacterized protein